MKTDLSDVVRQMYSDYAAHPIPLNEEYVVRAGVVVEQQFPPDDARSALQVLAALNLLNAAVKLPWGSAMVTYAYIKGMASCLMLRLLSSPFSGASVYLDMEQQVAYFHVLGVQVSFHYIPLYRELISVLADACRHPQQWEGVSLQHIAVELFLMACPDAHCYSRCEEQDARQAMLHYKKPSAERLFGSAVPVGRPVPSRPHPGPFREDKARSLQAALDFHIWQQNMFVLWRRKDSRPMPVMRYNGSNYHMLMYYLLGGRNRIPRRPEHTLERGKFYYVSPQKRVKPISLSRYIMCLTQNSYLYSQGGYRNLCITYGIARYLAVLFPELRFVCTLNYNHRAEQNHYYRLADFYIVPLESIARRLKVWMVVDTGNRLQGFDPSLLPRCLIDEYMEAEDYYQEFEVQRGDDGHVGLLAYRRYWLLAVAYRRILVRNYHAYVQSDDGLWAIYSLGQECFKTGFVYERIWYDSPRAAILGVVRGRVVTIFSFHLMHPVDPVH